MADQGPARQDLAGRAMNRLGLGTLGDFAALPARHVASRFGDAGERAHRLARGLDPRPLARRPPPADLSVAREFDPPEPRAEPAVFAAKAPAERLHAGLAARGLTCVRVQVRATWADGRESSRRWRHDGLLSEAAVADRVRWQLDGWRPAPVNPTPMDGAADDQCAEGGVTVLRLVPDQVIRAAGQQLTLWGETAVSDQLARALRVQALLGHEAVLRPVLGGGRDFASQVTPIPFGDKKRASLGRGPALAWPGHGCGAQPGFSRRPAGGGDRRRRSDRERHRALRGLGRSRPAGRARGAAAARHRLGRALAAVRALVGPGRRTTARPVPAGHGRRAGVAGGGPGRPLAGRGALPVRGGRGLG